MIDPMDYLSEDEIRDMCRDVVREQVTEALKSEKSLERIVTDMAYQTVLDACEETTGQDMLGMIEERIPAIVANLSSWRVFRPKDEWDRDESRGWTYLQEALEKARPLIDQRVAELVSEIDLSTVGDAFDSALSEAMRRSVLPNVRDEREKER